MTFLFWVRTSRAVDTLDDEIDGLQQEIGDYARGGYPAAEPFTGTDQVLVGIECRHSIHQLKRLLEPALHKDWFVDWSITEVGCGIGPNQDIEFDNGSYELHFDDRFIHIDESRSDGNPWIDEEPLDEQELKATRAAKAKGFSRLSWVMDSRSTGATVLWVDLDHEREDNDRLIKNIYHALPRGAHRLWQGRSSIAFGYYARHSFSDAAPYGISPAVKSLLDEDEVSFYLAFQVGAVSLGKIPNLNPMDDFIWFRREQSKKRPAAARTSDAESPRPAQLTRTVIVEKRHRVVPSLLSRRKSR